MPAKVTALGLTVLSALLEKPMHPYEIYQLLLDRKEDWLVKVRPGSLYHTMERLADHGLVESTGTDRSGRRPERTIYSITEAGRTSLRRRIGEIVSVPEYEYPVFPVALAELHELPMDEAIGLVQCRVHGLQAKIAEVDAILDQVRQDGALEAYWFTAGYLRMQLAGELDWLRGLIDRLKNGEMEWPETRL
ncbi:MAG TPA: PadR family transcriptional regulator [Mycobacteriales bacterium]|nr:PadR family transcriptional regulator [Mycobacteriales bacterium]